MVTKCPGAVYFFGVLSKFAIKDFSPQMYWRKLKKADMKDKLELEPSAKASKLFQSKTQHLNTCRFSPLTPGCWVQTAFYRWDHLKGERSQTQTHLLVLPQCTNCVWSAILREGRAGLKLESNIFCSSRPTWWASVLLFHENEAAFRGKDRPALGAPPLLVQLFCLTHGGQARTFNSHTKHTHNRLFHSHPAGKVCLTWADPRNMLF